MKRALTIGVLTAGLLVTAAPAQAATYANGCPKGSTRSSVKYIYVHSIPMLDGQRICRYQSFRRLPLIGWWSTGTVSRWAR